MSQRNLFLEVYENVLDNINDEDAIKKVKEKALNLCSQFPVYSSNKQAVA